MPAGKHEATQIWKISSMGIRNYEVTIITNEV
jgi:hypothetical protein